MHEWINSKLTEITENSSFDEVAGKQIFLDAAKAAANEYEAIVGRELVTLLPDDNEGKIASCLDLFAVLIEALNVFMDALDLQLQYFQQQAPLLGPIKPCFTVLPLTESLVMQCANKQNHYLKNHQQCVMAEESDDPQLQFKKYVEMSKCVLEESRKIYESNAGSDDGSWIMDNEP